MLGAAAADFGLHFGDFDGQLAVEGIAAGFNGDVAEADTDLRILAVAAVGRRAQRTVRPQDQRVAAAHEARQIGRPR